MSIHHKSQEEIASEADLIRKAQFDVAHFAPLYERYYKPIFVFIYRRTDDEALTSDLTSQVFLNALHHLPKYIFKGLPFSSWLYRIAVNEVNMHFRKSKKQRVLSIEDQQFDRIAEEVGDLEKEEKIEVLLKGLQGLSMEEVSFIEWRFFEDRSFKEIAEIVGITENNAKVKTYRILDKLKKMIRA